MPPRLTQLVWFLTRPFYSPPPSHLPQPPLFLHPRPSPPPHPEFPHPPLPLSPTSLPPCASSTSPRNGLLENCGSSPLATAVGGFPLLIRGTLLTPRGPVLAVPPPGLLPLGSFLRRPPSLRPKA